ncbi:hypothetical protein HYH03_007219 [Edaphochlamys debaryana]|uniref:Adhesin domain-containing protein n=1 Tax=Edaphochlamys debaryana TaxID=47281 RepID=A0A835Y970_9CHLO|nr:hypothetical protein HYH03_007219 [Edaphochlamys debaryana]|eukprot:KAG2494705.1 hypothetical protein HYH03_007219 [Edaphochlamys debaryana]
MSLDISTTDAPVHVAKLVEADLRVASGRGPLQLGSVRALQADVQAGGVQGGEMSGTRVFIASSGPIGLRRLVGGTMDLTVTTAPAPAASANADPAVALESAYGGRLVISTDGGAVRLGTTDCGDHLAPALAAAVGSRAAAAAGSVAAAAGEGDGGLFVSTRGGAVAVEGLEGVSELSSGGGAIQVRMQSGLRYARLRSGGGRVALSLDPAAALGRLEVVNAAAVTVDPALQPHVHALDGAGASQAPGGHGAGTGPGAVWRARVDAAPSAAPGGGHGRGGGGGGLGRRSPFQPVPAAEEGTPLVSGSSVGGGSGGVAGPEGVWGAGAEVWVDAGGGEVELRWVGWREVLEAKMREARELGA